MKIPWPPLLLWLALWLGGSAWCAWSLQEDIARAANETLAAGSSTRPAGTRFVAEAHGLHVVLKGAANRESDVKRAQIAVSEAVRIAGPFGFGPPRNPVKKVSSMVDFRPMPSGWGVLAATPSAVRLRGTTGSEFESQRIGTQVQIGAAVQRPMENMLVADGELCVESDQLEATLTSDLPPLADQTLRQGLLALARWGSPWRILDIDKPVETLRKELLEAGVPDSAWAEGIASDVERLRDARATWKAAIRDAKQRAGLPPGHVILALRADTLLLRGELGDAQARDLLVAAVKREGKSRHLVDELLRSDNRRPEPNVRQLANSIPPLPTGLLSKALLVGTPATGWKTVNLNAVDPLDESSFVAQIAPTGIDPRLAMPDMLAAIAWLNSIDSAPPQSDGAKRMPFILLVASGDRVLLRGAVAEESTRSQIEAAARKLYLTSKVDSNIRLDAGCAPSLTILHTVTSLPDLPPQNTTGLLAVAIAGETWHSKTMRADLLDAAGLERCGVLPEGITANQVMPELLDVSGIIRAHLDVVRRGERGIPLQSP